MTTQAKRTLLEVLTQDLELDPEAVATQRLSRRIEQHRELAVERMRKLRHQVDETIEALSNEDAGSWIWHARSTTDHAGYSNTMQANLAGALAELAQVTGMIERA